MILRLWHFLYRHRWVQHSTVFCGGTSKVIGYAIKSQSERLTVHGFTDIDYVCHCGAHRTVRMVGKRDTVADLEATELRRMAKL